jgi:excisionase family DNA binding protein
MKLLNTSQAAEALGVSARRIRAMIDAGTLHAHRIGREYAIEESALSTVKTYGKPGRPSKQSKTQSAKKKRAGA